jgi:sporulation protein YlmC with PRC-barrel domain
MQLRPNLKVISQEKQLLGRVKYILIDQTDLSLRGFVVQRRLKLFKTREIIVPLNVCLTAFRSEPIYELQLDLSTSQFETLPPYWEYQGDYNFESEANYSAWFTCNHETFFVCPMPEADPSLQKRRNCETDTIHLGKSVQVFLSDGIRGRISDFYFRQEYRQLIPHLSSVRVHFNLSSQPITIPAAWIKKIEGNLILLDLNRAELTKYVNWPGQLVNLIERLGQQENS